MADELKKSVWHVDHSKLKDDERVILDMLYKPDGSLIGPAPMREYSSDEEYFKEVDRANDEWVPAISIAELCKKDFPLKKWIVENIFERATIGQLSAAPNQWKSWLMCHMALCIATGKKVFDKFETDKQAVLIVNEEDPEMMLKERLLLLLDKVEDIPVYVHAEKGIKLEEETVDNLLEEIKQKNIGVIIFDSLSVIHTADENSAKEMGAVFEQMKRFTREGITVLFTNHHRKKSQKGGWIKDDIQEQTRGSTVINAVPAGHITCEERKRENDKFIIIRQAKLKGAKKLDPFLVKIDEGDGKIKFIFDSMFEEDVDSASKLKKQIYELIQESDKCLGVKDIKEATGKSDKSIRVQLKMLTKENLIQSDTRKTLIIRNMPVVERADANGSEKLYFKASDDIEVGL